MMSTLKTAVGTALLILTSTLGGLLLCEGIVRLAAPQRLDADLPGLYDPDDDLVFRLKKGFRAAYSNFEFHVLVETNKLGLREREIGPKQPGTFRILGLGDSFSFANGVTLEETYFKRLESCLNSSPTRSYHVINAAVPAHSLIQEFRYLQRYGMDLDPDAVLIGFYVGNDFFDSKELFDEHGTPLIYVQDGDLYSKKPADVEPNIIRAMTSPVRRFLQTRSHLYIFIRNRSSDLLARLGLRAPIPPPEFSVKELSPRMREGWDLTQRLLLELSSFTQQREKTLHVVILPTIYQVYESVWNEYVRVNKLDPGLYDLDKPQRILTEFCAKHDIACIDVLPAMRRAANDTQLFYRVDSHFNPQGHRVVADLLCAYFAARRPSSPAFRAK